MRSLLSERCRLEWLCSEFAQAIETRRKRCHRDVGHGLKKAKSKMKKRTCFESLPKRFGLSLVMMRHIMMLPADLSSLDTTMLIIGYMGPNIQCL